MNHIQPYRSRKILSLPRIKAGGWQLKRYALLAENRTFDAETASSALDMAIERLPIAGNLGDQHGNHGVGFQVIHFADEAVVSPIFYWIWGTVLANTHQLRAQRHEPTRFESGVKEVVGCVWELQIVCFETHSWTKIMLGETGTPAERLSRYIDCRLPTKEVGLS